MVEVNGSNPLAPIKETRDFKRIAGFFSFKISCRIWHKIAYFFTLMDIFWHKSGTLRGALNRIDSLLSLMRKIPKVPPGTEGRMNVKISKYLFTWDYFLWYRVLRLASCGWWCWVFEVNSLWLVMLVFFVVSGGSL